ncbi:uncharacterized protein LOC119734347 [Patiria miniata]|uniref:Uncharacterized protein n=1 Tax=Patiria miniata TaxID=46514 RepID=A0A914AJC1_PATMI|nr:uncharacterized protein LOC119734347 [Patiria miniata]
MFNGINQRIFMSVSMFGAPTPTVDWNTRPKPKNKSAKSKARSARAEFGSAPVKKGKGVRSLMGRLNCCLREPEVETDSLDAMERGEALDVVDVKSVEIKTSPQQSGGSSSCPATTPSPGDDQQSRQSSTPSTEDGKANEGKRRPSGLAKKGGLGGPFRRACGYLRDFWNKGSRTPMPPGGPPGFYEVANGSSGGSQPEKVATNSNVDTNHLTSGIPGPTKHRGKGTTRGAGSTKEGDRWKSVEATYTGRYTSKITPLLDTSSTNTSSSGGSIPRGVDTTSLGSNLLPAGVDARSVAAWAVTDWTSQRKENQPGQQVQSQPLAQAAQPSQPPTVICHGAGLAEDTGPTPVERLSNVRIHQETGYRRTQR